MAAAGDRARTRPASDAATSPGYRRREPDRTLLHATVRAHLRTFLAEIEQRGDGAGLPGFVITEFERYLECGILANGFARVRCASCGDELLVAFSCKGRGFCPSCTTRRMQGTATSLVDRVLPHVPMRQWVLSLPRWARFLLARDPLLITRTLDLALRAIFTFQRWLARRAGASMPRTGAVTFVQRFGGALNLNVHFHCLIPDGVFVRDVDSVRFLALPGPTAILARDEEQRDGRGGPAQSLAETDQGGDRCRRRLSARADDLPDARDRQSHGSTRAGGCRRMAGQPSLGCPLDRRLAAACAAAR